MLQNKRTIWTILLSGIVFLLLAGTASAGEADIKLPDLTNIAFLGGSLTGMMILNIGLGICVFGMILGLIQYMQTKKSSRASVNVGCV